MMLLVQALMLAASVDCTEGLSLLIEHGATIELQVMTMLRHADYCQSMQTSIQLCISTWEKLAMHALMHCRMPLGGQH